MNEHDVTISLLNAFASWSNSLTVESMATFYQTDSRSYALDKLEHFLKNPLQWWRSLDCANQARFAQILEEKAGTISQTCL